MSWGERNAQFARPLKFATSGVANTLFGYAVIFGLMALGVSPYVSNFIGYAAGMLLAFALHNVWVFNSETARRRTTIKYMTAVAICYLSNLAVLKGAIYLELAPWLGQIVSGAFYTGSLYLLCVHWIFKTKVSR